MASSTAPAVTSSVRRAIPGRPYFMRMISPCSVTRSRPATEPGGDARTAAREAKDEILDLLESEMLQEATVTEVVNALEANAAKARKLLGRMKAAGKTLDTIKKGAELATKILGTVKKILVA